VISHVQAKITALQAQQQMLEPDHQDYTLSLHALSQAIHPFHLNTGEPQLALELPARLQVNLSTLERLSHTYAPTQSQAALQRWQRQISDLAAILHAWWQWVLHALPAQTQDPDTQHWVLTALLPWVYWHQQTQRPVSPNSNRAISKRPNKHRRGSWPMVSPRPCPTLSNSSGSIGQPGCAKFQRTSSAVEGRNGYLSGLHQANRGFTEQTLKVLTVIHNFDLRRDDGTTAAQRLFGKPFPVLFDWVVLHMGELPRPRRTLKAPKSKSRPYMLSRLKLLP
jgi:hypothetical protein